MARDEGFDFECPDEAGECLHKGGGIALKGQAEGAATRQVPRPGCLCTGNVDDGVSRCVRGAEPVELDKLPPQVDPEVFVEDDVRQAQRHALEDFRFVSHTGEEERLLLLHVRHPRSGLALLDNQSLRREGAVPEGMVPVVIGVDEVADGLVRHFAHPFLDLAGHRDGDMGVDHEHALFAHHEAPVVHVLNRGEQGIDAFPDLLNRERTPGRIEKEPGEALREMVQSRIIFFSSMGILRGRGGGAPGTAP